MLQGEIKRDFQHNYLVFHGNESDSSYVMQMLMHQKINNLLPCMVRKVDGKQLYSYDISNKESMKHYFEGKDINYLELEGLLIALAKVVGAMKDYLLDMKLLVLEPEYIFLNEETKQWFFIGVPQEEGNAYDALHKLSKYILTVLNHKEEKAVQLGYALYRSTMSEHFQLSQVLSSVKDNGEDDEQVEKTTRSAEIDPGEQTEQDRFINEGTEADIITEKEDVKKSTYQWKNKKTPAKKASVNVNQSGNKGQKNKKKQNRSWLPFSKEREKNTYNMPSAVLSYAAEGSFAYGNSKCILKGVTYPRKSLKVQGFPYLIGSLECAVDGYVDNSKVGHFHARMEQQGTEYYIVDLNSKYGTFVNGRRLSGDEQELIKDGDKIVFGDEEYIFLNKKERDGIN